MGPQLQLLTVALLVALAGYYVARSAWRAFAGTGKACGSECGKCVQPAAKTGQRTGLIALDQVPSRPAAR